MLRSVVLSEWDRKQRIHFFKHFFGLLETNEENATIFYRNQKPDWKWYADMNNGLGLTMIIPNGHKIYVCMVI